MLTPMLATPDPVSLAVPHTVAERYVAFGIHGHAAHPAVLAVRRIAGVSPLLVDRWAVPGHAPQFVPADPGMVQAVDVHAVVQDQGLVVAEVPVGRAEH